jgi:hypothetical protein
MYKEVECDSEAETLVGSESDDDGDGHWTPPNDQHAAGNRAAGWTSANEPCERTQNNIDAAKEVEYAMQRSLSLIPGARRKQDKENYCQ